MKEKQSDKLLGEVLPILNDYSVLAGFLLSFVLFFIRPVFLNAEHVMAFPVYIPTGDEIGLDLNQMLSYCESFFINHKTPYIGNNLYPPLATVIFGPLLLLDKIRAYEVITIISVLAYIVSAWILPGLIIKNRQRILIVQLFFLSGLFSYGFQFELERGQFNLIAFSFALLAVYLFHYKTRYRLLAYLLLTLAIQLKVFPVIFLAMLIDDWTDWKNNVKRLAGMIGINILFMFVLGYQVFLDFIRAISKQALHPHITITNHSIKVFVELLSRKVGYRDLFLARGMSLEQVKALAEYSNTFQLGIQIFVFSCLLVILLRAIKINVKGINPYLLSACTILTLVFPSVSNDYKLPLIVGPTAIVLQEWVSQVRKNNATIGLILLGFVGSIAYSTTLFSYTNKPLLLSNNLPSLLVILLVVTILSAITDEKPNLSQQIVT